MVGTKLLKNMTLEEFDNGYFYATEIKAFAKSLGVKHVAVLRKDELEKIIRNYLKTGEIKQSRRKSLTTKGAKDSDLGLRLDMPIKNYTNNKVTKDFLLRESQIMDPDFKLKSGAMYRINRWREAQIDAGHEITYGDLVAEFVSLNAQGNFKPIASTYYINFLSEHEAHEKGATREDAINAWHELKAMDAPKTYAGWKASHQEKT